MTFQWQNCVKNEIQRQHSLDSNVDSRNLELFKEDLDHFFFVFGGIHVGLCEEDRTLVGSYLEKGEGMFPELLHIVPMVDHAMRERVLQLIQSPFAGVELFSDVGLLLVGRVGDNDIIFGSPHSA